MPYNGLVSYPGGVHNFFPVLWFVTETRLISAHASHFKVKCDLTITLVCIQTILGIHVYWSECFMNVAPGKNIVLVSPSTSVFLSKANVKLISFLTTSKKIHFTLIIFGSKENAA